MQKIVYKSLATLLLILFYSCSDDQSIKPADTPGKQLSEKDPAIQRILEAGFKKEDIVEYTDHYVVEGDIAFYKKEPAPRPERNDGRTQHARAPFLLSAQYAANVKVYLNSASFSINLNNIVNVVINAYNEVNAGGLRMTRVYSAAEADIQIIRDNGLPLNVCGRAGFPLSDGRPFDRVSISETALTLNNVTETGQLIFLIAHELGHCLGFRHTNWAQLGEEHAAPIPYTPDSDRYSVFNGGSCGNSWNAFTYDDTQAIRILYPTNVVVPPGGGDRLTANQQLPHGQFIRSPDGRFTLIMQHDGNLVLYFYNQAIWSTGTCCDSSIQRVTMQGDGNLVLYDAGGAPRWHTHTYMYPGSLLILQNDGNLVIYQNGSARWWSGTCCY